MGGYLGHRTKIGCVAQTLCNWMCQYERETGQHDGCTTAEAEQIRALLRKNRKLKKADEILCLTSAIFAQAELDRNKNS